MNERTVQELQQEVLTTSLLLAQANIGRSKSVATSFCSPAWVDGKLYTIRVDINLNPSESAPLRRGAPKTSF